MKEKEPISTRPFENTERYFKTFNRNSVTTIHPVCWFSNIMGRRVSGNPIEKQHYHTIMATLKQKYLMGTLTFH
jgi:hypothetical protein